MLPGPADGLQLDEANGFGQARGRPAEIENGDGRTEPEPGGPRRAGIDHESRTDGPLKGLWVWPYTTMPAYGKAAAQPSARRRKESAVIALSEAGQKSLRHFTCRGNLPVRVPRRSGSVADVVHDIGYAVVLRRRLRRLTDERASSGT